MKIVLKGLTLAALFCLSWQSSPHQLQKEASECYYQVDGIRLSESDIESLQKNTNPLCRKWQGDSCIQCAHRSWMNKKGYCIQVDPYCQKFDLNKGQCVRCYLGYEIDAKGKCEIERAGLSVYDNNPYCAKWERGVCVACAERSYFLKNGICQAVDPNCKAYDKNTGQCKQCYQGYELSSRGTCQVPTLDEKKSGYDDPLCALWQNSGKCVKCAHNSYFGKDGRCTAVDPLCKRFKQGSGCVQCYTGYTNLNGKCVIAQQIKKVCKGGICDKTGGNCQIVNSQASLTLETQQKVVERGLKWSQNIDKYCQNFKNGKCQQCFPGFILNEQGICVCQR